MISAEFDVVVVGAGNAATVFGAAGVASLSGRIIGGLAADRIGAKRMIVFGLALQALSAASMCSPVIWRAFMASRCFSGSPTAR